MENKSVKIRDIHEINSSDLSTINEKIYEILNPMYFGPFKNISLLDEGEAKKKWKKLIHAWIPLQFYENPSILIENDVDRSSKIFYIDEVPCWIITYKLNLQKEQKYIDMLEKHNFEIKNWYVELKSFFAFSNQQKKWLGTIMMEKMFDFFKFNLWNSDGILVTVNKDKWEYVYNFFIKHDFKDIGSEHNKKTDKENKKSEHILYRPR